MTVSVKNLTVAYRGRVRQSTAVANLTFAIARGESYGLVGESGSGKTTAAMALTRYLPENSTVTADHLMVGGVDVLELDAKQLRDFRATELAVVYQEPGLALNPTMPIGQQVSEIYRLHGASRAAALDLTVGALGRVRLPAPDSMVRRYPHELSGGQQQRVVIAMALAAEPALLVLDEPTTGLDSGVEAEIMSLIDELRSEIGFASILISHNLPLIAAHCERIGVLRNGELVEEGAAADVLMAPRHPYTRMMVAALPDLSVGRAPAPALAIVDRADGDQEAAPTAPIVTVHGIVKRFGGSLALNDVSLTIGRGEVLGIVGESGSGKTTLGRVIAGITTVDEGAVIVDRVVRGVPPVQVVFQNPDSSLNPRRTVRQVLGRSIRLLGGTQSVEELADTAGLAADLLDRLPHQLSGGQKQRVAIARAFGGQSPLIVCDEPTSALDVTIQKRILDLLVELQERTSVSYLFISHDLAVVRQLSHRIGVLHQGRLVEIGDAEQVFEAPRHDYTASLVESSLALRRRSAPHAARASTYGSPSTVNSTRSL
jgi:peptide/nickel transport system ATP-binding protein